MAMTKWIRINNKSWALTYLTLWLIYKNISTENSSPNKHQALGFQPNIDNDNGNEIYFIGEWYTIHVQWT